MPSDSPAELAPGREIVSRFHELTKNGPIEADRSSLLAFAPADPTNRPAAFKRYLGLETNPLPRDVGVSGERAIDALAGEPRSSRYRFDARLLARLLFHSAGVTRATTWTDRPGRTWFRAAPSAGNLHPIEIYAVVPELPDAPAGVHHFAPLQFGLTQLRPGDWRSFLATAAAEPRAEEADCVLVLTGIPWRTAWKYGERGWRHLYWDAGAILANLLAMASACGIPAQVLVGFVDSDVATLVGVNGRSEFPIALVLLGDRGTPAPPAGDAPAPTWSTSPLSVRPLILPLVTDVQRAGDLADPSTVAAWRSAAEQATVEKPATSPVVPGPGALPSDSIEDVILRRGSTRLMQREEAPADLLVWAMGVAARPFESDAAGDGASLLGHWLAVHSVSGTAPGAYRWDGGDLAPLELSDLRARAQETCLGQPLAGDSAFTAFHAGDLDQIVDRLGPRGYRAAQLEAGVVGGRLALAAFALRRGATGLTFYDDAVSSLFASSASCMLTTAVGTPAYRNRVGGSPGEATELEGYTRLMGMVGRRPNPGR